MALQPQQEMPLDIGVAETAVASEHHLEEHVLRKQDAAEEAGVDQPLDRGGVLLIRGALDLLIGVPIVHADHVVFEEGAAFGERGLVRDVGARRIHVAEHGMADVAAFFLDDVEDAMGEPEPCGQMHHQRQLCPALRAHRPAQALFFVRREHRGDADLADEADFHA